MGLLSSSTSISRFRIKGEVPPDYKERYPLQIRRYSFRYLDEGSIDERSVGWVSMQDVWDNKFKAEEFFKDSLIALSLRVDVRKPPPSALKYYCQQAEADEKARLNKKFLSKTERKQIRERVYLQLLKRAIPRTSAYDMIWNLKTGRVLFSSLNNNLCGEFAELFKKTFGISLIPLFPYTIAQNQLTEEQLKLVDQTRPYSFY
jgi:DNA recombination-dependent growth factor C